MGKLMEVRFWDDDRDLRGARLKAPDYQHWAKVDILTKAEAVLILHSIDPSHVEKKGVTPEHFIEYLHDPEDLKISMDKILKELNSSNLKPVSNLSGHDGIKRIDFIKWAKSKKHEIPRELLWAETELIMEGPTPPYLDPNHKHYSTELATSIEVWMQLFQSDAEIKTQPHPLIDQIQAALEKKGFAGTRENSRLATGINPNWNKRGGSTKNKQPKTKKIKPVKK